MFHLFCFLVALNLIGGALSAAAKDRPMMIINLLCAAFNVMLILFVIK